MKISGNWGKSDTLYAFLFFLKFKWEKFFPLKIKAKKFFIIATAAVFSHNSSTNPEILAHMSIKQPRSALRHLFSILTREPNCCESWRVLGVSFYLSLLTVIVSSGYFTFTRSSFVHSLVESFFRRNSLFTLWSPKIYKNTVGVSAKICARTGDLVGFDVCFRMRQGRIRIFCFARKTLSELSAMCFFGDFSALNASIGFCQIVTYTRCETSTFFRPWCLVISKSRSLRLERKHNKHRRWNWASCRHKTSLIALYTCVIYKLFAFYSFKDTKTPPKSFCLASPRETRLQSTMHENQLRVGRFCGRQPADCLIIRVAFFHKLFSKSNKKDPSKWEMSYGKWARKGERECFVSGGG